MEEEEARLARGTSDSFTVDRTQLKRSRRPGRDLRPFPFASGPGFGLRGTSGAAGLCGQSDFSVDVLIAPFGEQFTASSSGTILYQPDCIFNRLGYRCEERVFPHLSQIPSTELTRNTDAPDE